MKNVKIAYRITLCFAVFLAMVIGLVAFSLSQMRTIQMGLQGGLKNGTELVTRVAEMQTNVVDRALAARNAVFLTGAAELRKQADTIKRESAAFDGLVRQHAELAGDSASLTKVRGAAVEYDSKIRILARYAADKVGAVEAASAPAADNALAELAGVQQSEMVAVIENQLVPAEQQLLRSLDALMLHINTQIAQPVDQAAANYVTTRRWLIGCAVLAIVIGAVVAWRVTQGLVRPIRKAMLVAKDIAQGDLTTDIQVRRRDESGLLFSSLSHMQEALQRIATRITSVTSVLDRTTDQLAADRSDLAQRTEEQAATIEETAAVMQSFREALKTSAQDAQRASEAAREAQQIVLASGQAMDRVKTGMDRMGNDTKRVAEVTAMIDAIAFQTNILALNAAVEAARAGDQGRGFAVVASEVRRLAQQCTTAAKEIRELIGATLTGISASTEEVHQAIGTMDGLVTAAQNAAQAMSNVAQSSREQAISVEEVNLAVQQLGKVTQQNSALVDRSQATVDALQSQTDELIEAVSRFKLKQHFDSSGQETATKNAGDAPSELALLMNEHPQLLGSRNA